MASTFEPKYGGAPTAITCTRASLAASAYRQAAGVDNTSTLALEVHITGFLKTGASGTVSGGFAALYGAGYDGSRYGNNMSGSDSAFTPDLQGNLLNLATIGANANATTFYYPSIYFASATGLIPLPNKWTLAEFNGSGAAFDATAGNFSLEFQAINTQAV